MRSESPEERGRQKVGEPPSYRIENEYNPEAMPQYFQFFTFGSNTSPGDLQSSTLSFAVMEPRCCVSPRLLGEAHLTLRTVWKKSYYQVLSKWVQLSLPRVASVGSVGFLKVEISITCRAGVEMMPPDTWEDNIDEPCLLSSGSEQQPANFIITIHGAFELASTSRPRKHSHRHHCTKPPNTFVRVLFFGLQAETAVQNQTKNPVYNEQVSMVEMFPTSNPIIRFEVCTRDNLTSRLLASTFLNMDNISHDGENGFLPTFGPSLLPMYASPPGNVSLTEYPHYRGSLLVTMRTIVPYYQQSLRSVTVEPLFPNPMETYWTVKSFCIFCPIFEVSMLDSRLAGSLCGVAITTGDIPSENILGEEFTCMMNEIKTRKLHYTGSLDVIDTKSKYGCLDFSNTYPVLQLATRLPDYRFRMFKNNAIHKMISMLTSMLKETKLRLKSLEDISPVDLLVAINKNLDHVVDSITHFLGSYITSKSNIYLQGYRTELDVKQLLHQREELRKIQLKIQKLKLNITDNSNFAIYTQAERSVTRRDVKRLLSEVDKLVWELEKLICDKVTEGWPDIVIWLLNSGSRIGFCKIGTADILYSNTIEECGRDCGRIQTVYFKPLKCSRHVSMACFCVLGKMEILAWMGLHEEKNVFEHCLPAGCKLKIKNYDMCVKCNGIMIECRVFIYKAKLFCNEIMSNLGQVFLRINILNTTKDSSALERSSLLVWNEMLTLRKVIFTSSDRLLKYPPVVFVEIYSADLSGNIMIIGSFQMNSVVNDQKNDSGPSKLKWNEIYKGRENMGKVLMSVQILQIPETILKSTIYNPFEESCLASDLKELGNYFTIEPIPPNLVPKLLTYKLDIYWWGLRNINITKKPCVILEIEDLIVKSEVIADKKSNCNFPNGRVSQIFDASFNKYLTPSITMKLYDNCTFGRTLYYGTKVTKKPTKFFINYYPKTEREESLMCASILSSDFVKVNETLYIKQRNSALGDNAEFYDTEPSCSSTNIRMKGSKWRRLFCRNEPDEEEYTLLPVFKRKFIKDITTTNKAQQHQATEKKDWWSTYIHSLQTIKDNVNIGNIFKIYDSELECQPQFSKFKDWCATLKLYNGERTGIPEKDEEVQCGQLKIGIAIYKWPPLENTYIVSSSGVDLKRGYFHDYPKNDTVKFLIRLYVIKGIKLKAKDFISKPNPYIVINCGRKNLGERKFHVPNTFNPIFSSVHELRCSLPEDNQLTISLYNYDVIGPDDLIGSTTIDLENRIYTKHRACVGLASKYDITDPTKWRDHMKPSAILEEICVKNHLPSVSFPSISTVMVNGVEYKDTDQATTYATTDEIRENICLNLLHNWDSFPICGYPLVPRHVETRNLYNPEQPGITQGKIHTWLDIFPLNSCISIPPPVDITPSKSVEYELRLTICSVKLFDNKTNISSKTSSLFIKAWTGYLDQMQSSKPCSISPNGFYVFNCKMIFNLNYDVAQSQLVKNEIHYFDENVETQLVVNLMSTGSSCIDEPVGALTLNLKEMPREATELEYLNTVSDRAKKINLFDVNNMNTWLFLDSTIPSYKRPVGAIKLDFTLLLKGSTLSVPDKVGRGVQSHLPSSRSRLDESYSNDYIKNFFYRHNALWGSLTGIFIIIISFTVTIYFIFNVI